MRHSTKITSPSLSPLKFHEPESEFESQGHESECESEFLKSGLESDSSPDLDLSLPNTGSHIDIILQ